MNSSFYSVHLRIDHKKETVNQKGRKQLGHVQAQRTDYKTEKRKEKKEKKKEGTQEKNTRK
jgi:hypothetical protein